MIRHHHLSTALAATLLVAAPLVWAQQSTSPMGSQDMNSSMQQQQQMQQMQDMQRRTRREQTPSTGAAHAPTSGSDSVSGTITAVDSSSGVVTVKSKDNGNLRIPLSSSALAKVKSGDTINVSLSYSIASQ